MSFISYLINGLSLGSVYAIIALGYTMVYGIAKMLNFAHGDIIMVGAYVALMSMTQAGMPPAAAVLAAVVVCTVLGVVIERIAYKPLRNASSSLAVLITAIGVSYLLQNLALLIFGANTQTFSSVITWKGITLAGGSLNISGVTIVTIVACIIIMIALVAFVQKTKPGQAMRAVSEDKGAAHADFRDRLCAGSHCRRASLFRISQPDALYRSHARDQGVRRSRVRWDRFDPGSIYWRTASRHYRDPRKSVYLFTDGRCARVCSADHCASREAVGPARQTDSGESVGAGYVEEKNE